MSQSNIYPAYDSYSTAYAACTADCAAYVLCDMDSDGIPELITYESDEAVENGEATVYEFAMGAATQLGIINGSAYLTDDPAYPGIFIREGNHWNYIKKGIVYELLSQEISDDEMRSGTIIDPDSLTPLQIVQ